jgi:hypothetical protein
VLLPVLAFALLGVYLLQASKAETPAASQTPPLLSLAPTELDLLKGEVVNVAVNVGGAADQAQTAKAVIKYPASLKLQAVRDLCPAPGFSQPQQTDPASFAGTVTVSCQQAATSNSRSTMAILIFEAVADSGTAAIDIDSSSEVKQLGGSVVEGAKVGSRYALMATRATGPVKPRAIIRHQSKDLCATSEPDVPHCASSVRLNADGSTQVPEPRAVVDGIKPFTAHIAYQLPCAPGGLPASACATPATFGPQTIALAVYKDYSGGVSGLEQDLAYYNQYFGIAACTQANGCLKVVNQDGGSTLPVKNAADSGWDNEIMLDLVSAHALCQTCKILMLEADGGYPAIAQANNYAATQPNVWAVSNSWFVPDDSAGRGPLDADFHHLGILQFAAAGDDGTWGPTGKDLWPADLPEVVSVAGTTLSVNTDATYAGESTWKGSGGGCSRLFNKPSWQANLGEGCSTRAAGDIAMVGDPDSGQYLWYKGAWKIAGGTSLATPMAAATYVLANKHAGSVMGSSVPYTYSTSANTNDITTGDNCITGVTVRCTAKVGFDVPTGLGSPKGVGMFGGAALPVPKTGDLNGDSKVNLADLSLLLSKYGSTNVVSDPADINKDHTINLADMSILLANYGK